MAGASLEPIGLIINADDFGYFPCVSKGILNVAQSRHLTAIGILATSSKLNDQIRWLDGVNGVDFGVHLNLSFGSPLTQIMSEKLSAWCGRFPGVFGMTGLILSGKITLKDVRLEWAAQIEACAGKKLMFLNSHEHIHMLPMLFELAVKLADEYAIPHVRLTRPEWIANINVRILARNFLIQPMYTINRLKIKNAPPIFVGLGQSGRLDLAYLEKVFCRFKPGNTYELMCHPGYFDINEITDTKLITYHEWEKESALLQSYELQQLYNKYNIRLQNY